MNWHEPYEAEVDRQARADRGATKCDCCGGMIRVGEIIYYLAPLDIYICKDCEGTLVASAQVHGQEDADEITFL